MDDQALLDETYARLGLKRDMPLDPDGCPRARAGSDGCWTDRANGPRTSHLIGGWVGDLYRSTRVLALGESAGVSETEAYTYEDLRSAEKGIPYSQQLLRKGRKRIHDSGFDDRMTCCMVLLLNHLGYPSFASPKCKSLIAANNSQPAFDLKADAYNHCAVTQAVKCCVKPDDRMRRNCASFVLAAELEQLNPRIIFVQGIETFRHVVSQRDPAPTDQGRVSWVEDRKSGRIVIGFPHAAEIPRNRPPWDPSQLPPALEKMRFPAC
jgi:hypothetical protein